MEQKEKKAVLEAVLYTMGEAVELTRLSELIEEKSEKTHDILLEMQTEYETGGRGITLVELEDSFQMCTRPAMYEYIIKIAKSPAKRVLTDTLLETLAIIAYKQPLTRTDVEKIRGVNSDHVVNRLLEFGLIAEVGRLDAPGRPLLFGTTEEFLRGFGIKSLADLPQPDGEQIEELKLQAEQEIVL